MRKVNLLLLVVFLLVGLIGGGWASKPVSAIESPDEGVSAMARFYPAHTLFFAAARIDAGHLDIFDSLMQMLLGGLSDFGVPSLNLRVSLSFALGVSVDDLVGWLGDHAAVGVITLRPDGQFDPNSVYAVIELEDRAKVEAFLIDKGIAAPAGEGTLTYTVLQSTAPGFPVTVELHEDYMVIAMSPRGNFMQTREARLTSNENYQQLMTSLPASSYNILLYSDYAAMLELGEPLPPSPITDDATQLAIALTVLNGDTLAIDTAQLPGPNGGLALGAVPDPDFMRFIPGDAMAVIHASDLTAFYDNVASAVRVFSDYNFQQAQSFNQPGATSTPAPPPSDPVDQVEESLKQIGIDLHADLLSWTTGDYALFARADTVPIVRDFMAYQPNVEGRYDFGVVIEATDAAGASAFEDKLVNLIEQGLEANQTTEVTISTGTIGTTEVTTIDFDIEGSGPVFNPMQAPAAISVPVSLVLGANDEVFFLMTRGAAVQVLNGGATLADDETYLAAREYLLPNTTSMWYTNGEGTLLMTGLNPIIVLGLLGPSIGSVFDEIVRELVTVPGQPTLTPSPTPSPTPTPTPDMALIDQQLEPLRYAIGALEHGTISATVNEEGVSMLRFTITLSRKLSE